MTQRSLVNAGPVARAARAVTGWAVALAGAAVHAAQLRGAF